ncbi:MAG: sedoheptulokinase [Victivallales bacterium]
MLTLGIDLGTTKTAAVLYDPEKPEAGCAVSAEHHAASSCTPGCAEQNAEIMYEAVLRLLAELPSRKLTQIKAIGLTGQMHSVVLWNGSAVSPIVTWQDKRASAAGHLDEFRALSGHPLSDGFGAATLAELVRQNGLRPWQYAASPADWLAVRLTGIQKPVMDPTFAASWGIYDCGSGGWDREAAVALNIPDHLLPRIVPSGSTTGLTRNVPGIPDGIPVIAPFGDNQASVLGTAQELEQELFLTLGTGAQLSLVVTPEQVADWQIPPSVELRPFLYGKQLAVTAPLCGGRAWAWLGDLVNGFLSSLGLEPLPEKSLLDRLDALALESEAETGLRVAPHFLGERYALTERGSISGITLQNFTLPHLAHALASGIVHNLAGSFPPKLYQSRKRVVGSGNCVRFCRSVQREIELQFQLPLELRSVREEAAVGAAKLAGQAVCRN